MERLPRRLYRSIPSVLVRVARPVVRTPNGSPSEFLARLSTPYEDAVTDMGFAHWENKVKAFGLVEHEAVLDVGCGPGQWLPVLAKHNGRVVGVDVADLLEFARRHTRDLGNVGLSRMAGEHLALSDASFDALLCYGVLPYVAHELALSEFARVLRPGGRLVLGSAGYGYYLKNISEGLRHGDVEAVRYGLDILLVKARPFVQPQVTSWSRRGLRRLVKRHGFTVEAVASDPPDAAWPKTYSGASFFSVVTATKSDADKGQ